MTAEWIAFLLYLAIASVIIAAAIINAIVLTRQSRAEHHLEAAERLR